MSSYFPAHSISMSRGIGLPSYHLRLSTTSVLDTTYVDKGTGRPLYATITRSGVTTLYRFKGREEVEDVGQIQWNSGAVGKQTIIFHGRAMPCEEFVRKSKKGLFGGVSYTFDADGQCCKWKSDDVYGFKASTIGYPGMRVWYCQSTPSTLTTLPSSSAPFSGRQSVEIPLLARLAPPQPGFINSEFYIYPAGVPVIDELLFTAIMVAAGKTEWRTRESPIGRTRESLGFDRRAVNGLPLYRRGLTPGHQRVQSMPMNTLYTEEFEHGDLPPYRSTLTVNAGAHIAGAVASIPSYSQGFLGT
ncbi:hypothetical protein EW146_g8710 [Bondarzewia mesenterica]|uniref:DUF6593 domain-containing protein n=1 Tax=Bondarzewia mesenterica TaxID=1095465 RepID=A0A4V3XDE4_9AGAM|nr:hypothetical protein EW146_g8710 [Bondarzewia mesenterica]